MEGDVWLRRRVVLIIVSVASILALFTISAAILHPYLDRQNTTPTILENWGGLIIGFYFGTIVNLLKDWMSPSGAQSTTGTANTADGTRPPEAVKAEPPAVPKDPPETQQAADAEVPAVSRDRQ